MAFACGGKAPPKEPTITETVADAGPEDAAPPEPPKPVTLYDRLGGKDGVAKVVDGMLTKLAAHDATKKRFAKLAPERLEKLRSGLADYICHEAGGECEDPGDSFVKEAFKGMKITEAEWTAAVSSLKESLDSSSVEENEQNDLIATLAPTKEDIVEVKPKPGKR